MRPVRLAICERPLREDRSTRFISPMNVVVSRLVLVESQHRVSVLMRDLREGSRGADVDPLRVATLAGLAVTFAMAAALRQRRTNNAADDDDDEPAAARPRARRRGAMAFDIVRRTMANLRVSLVAAQIENRERETSFLFSF